MMRYSIFAAVLLAAMASLALAVAVSIYFLIAGLLLGALALLGIWDLWQPRHSILRNYPVIGHMRWLFEGIRPEIRQYLIESDQDEEPFSREVRSLVYQRAKGQEDKRPFGTRERVYDAGYSWLTHSIAARHIEDSDFRVTIGGPDCRQPYEASLYNISAMSFGALSANAILALNQGAKAGGFAHDTGEGGISRYHREGGGDLIYEIGTGYFGCRDAQGRFDPDRFREQALAPQIKMVEVKLSQGAKPGHGGMLPAAKITPEIAEARGVPMDRDCISPPGHSAFTTPIEFMEFLGRLRELSDGKPVGFKLCIGHRREFMCMVKAMVETGIVPDFIVVDGKEGGTGAAPLEFSNHIGTPLVEGLTFVHNTLRGAGLRDRIRIGAAGKLVTAFDIARICALGADWCNSARGFMFAVGCIQAQSCHTNRCPTGVATQDPVRQRALVPADKSVRVTRFHANTLRAVADMVGAAGLRAPIDLEPRHFNIRLKSGETVSGDVAFPEIPVGCLNDPDHFDEVYSHRWARARAESFAPVD
ncbi:FMN-binding glutamate synthase family protein [Marivibrio halodurans]|uniref:FMN-binding glutamate synthase family protein n=1 Tax=Marivibrio halodurans TaxID=2039722 RepID=A0A8J7V339_9PROT|nr:FMN-binding glutamate synthase family protein [Marivibrio halodurans]MBP5857985.1 FMN-binding glutamate synthase family protein [Marivibrio halodurans]